MHLNRCLLLCLAIIAVAASAWTQTPATEEIREIGSLRPGEFVIVRGEVIRFRERDEIRIQDSSGRVDVYLGEQPFARPPFQLGDTIVAAGWVDDDWFDFPRELYATEIILSDGTSIAINSERWD
jgi:uncharacterized protein YdeI (BOF family)